MTAKKKMYYRMGEVCKIAAVEPHSLRYWETEFDQLKPRKNRSGHRVFTAEDIELVKRIKSLVHDEGYTIGGARKRLAEPDDAGQKRPPDERKRKLAQEIRAIRGELEKVLETLDSNG